MRLRYWGRLTEMGEDKVPRVVYKQSRERMEREESEGKVFTDTWCVYSKKLLNELGLEEYWREGSHQREERLWREECMGSSKLRTYVKIKSKLEQEKYLSLRERYGGPEFTKLRGGTNRLRREQGRYRGIGGGSGV